MSLESLKPGDAARVVDRGIYSGRETHVCNCTVERVTAAQIHVLNQHGNRCSYWKRNGLGAGGSGNHALRAK